MGTDRDPSQADWAEINMLGEPTRRHIYRAVLSARRPLTRDEASAATGVSRRLAAFHLDQLAQAGLLAVDFARPAGRSGPGAGRPAKRYVARSGDVAVSLPVRRYDLAARLLAQGIYESGPEGPAQAAGSAAAEEGRRIGAAGRIPGHRRSGGRLSRSATLAQAEAALHDLGYEPARQPGGLRLGNCPFRAVVDTAPELVCGMNHRFVGGLLAGLAGHAGVTAELQPAPPDCCVRVVSSR